MNSFSKQKSDRIEWIDFGKGFAIFLVVIGHVFTGLFDSGKFTSDAKWLSIVIAFIYILDEPTNSLDIQSLREVRDLLSQFEGALLVISHDRDFLESLSYTMARAQQFWVI